MVPDLTLEVIYLNESTDFKMEFDICGAANIRFLSHLTHSKSTFLSVLGKSASRSRVITAVGSFNPLDELYLPKIIANATGYKLKGLVNSLLEESSLEYSLPESAIELITKTGVLGGAVLESNDQAIIMLTADREIRHEIVSTLICPYLKMLAGKTPCNLKEIKKDLSASIEAPVPKDLKGEKQDEKAEVSLSASLAVKEEFLEEPEIEIKTSFREKRLFDFEPQTSLQEDVGFVVLEQPENSEAQKLGVPYDTRTDRQDLKNKKTVIKSIISVVIVFAVMLSAYLGYEFVYQPMHYSAVLKETLELYGQSWSGLPENMHYKFGKLYKINKDIVGWISIPDTEINLPVVSSAHRTDSYYKNHLFEGSMSNFGTPFTYSNIAEDTYARNVVIYGKGEGKNNAFSEIKEFLKLEKYRAVPVLSFDSVYLEQRFKIFSVYREEKSSHNEWAKSSFFDDSDFLAFANAAAEKSNIKTNIDLRPNDELLTIVCEDKNENVILVARKVREGESPLVSFDSAPNDTSSKKPEVADNPLEEIVDSSSNTETSSQKPSSSNKKPSSNIVIGEDRFEQEEPTSSTTVKPNSESSSKKPVSSKPSASSENASSDKDEGSDTQNGTSSSEKEPLNLPEFTVKNSLNGELVTLPANEIVAQVVEAEMGSHFHEEALKAQAVAAYSWLLSSGAATGSTPSVPMKPAGAKAKNATDSVAGVVALYDGNVAFTPYFPISAGKTADSGSVWSSNLPYLKSVDSSVDKNADKFQTIKTYSSAELARLVKESSGIDLTKIADKNSWFKCTYDSGGVYVKTINVGGIVHKGTYLRTDILNYSIRSSAYTISYSKFDDKFKIVVKGYGHGVGMSQVGANYYAGTGLTYEQILKHYYTGITLGKYLDEE